MNIAQIENNLAVSYVNCRLDKIRMPKLLNLWYFKPQQKQRPEAKKMCLIREKPLKTIFRISANANSSQN
jgi:ABC-type transport system involved in Fe-S cluster assembly fused permease/ATPase subunit